MNWDILVEVLMDKISDADMRQGIYKAILEYCDYSDVDMIEDVLGTDSAFDVVARDFLHDVEEDDDLFEEYDDDDDYEEEE